MSKLFSRLAVAFAAPLLLVLAGCENDQRAKSLIQSIDPFCEHKTPIRERATISLDGLQLRDEVVFQETTSRRWISIMNADGCRSTHGTTFVFRSPDNRLVILPRGETRTIGFIINNADTPTSWQRFYVGSDKSPVHVVKYETFATNLTPRDRLTLVASSVLKADFSPRHGREYWGISPTPRDFIPSARFSRESPKFHPFQDPIILEPGAVPSEHGIDETGRLMWCNKYMPNRPYEECL